MYRKTGLLNLLNIVKLGVSSLAKDTSTGSSRYWVDTRKYAKNTKVKSFLWIVWFVMVCCWVNATTAASASLMQWAADSVSAAHAGLLPGSRIQLHHKVNGQQGGLHREEISCCCCGNIYTRHCSGMQRRRPILGSTAAGERCCARSCIGEIGVNHYALGLPTSNFLLWRGASCSMEP